MPVKKAEITRLLRLLSAELDTGEAVDACSWLMSGSVPDGLADHVITGMVVAYGRPFTANHGLGSLSDDVNYSNFPDPSDSEMVRRHGRLIQMRNQFLAHSSVMGLKAMVYPPGSHNPLRPTHAPPLDWDVNAGRRRFKNFEFIEWLKPAPELLRKLLRKDIVAQLKKCYGRNKRLTSPFSIETGADTFAWR